MTISSTLSTLVSGLDANTKKVQAAANNIVNVSTPDYTPRRIATTSLVTTPGPLGDAGGAGVRAVLAHGGNVTDGGEGVDLAFEVVSLMEASMAYKANAKALQIIDDMVRDGLDIQA